MPAQDRIGFEAGSDPKPRVIDGVLVPVDVQALAAWRIAEYVANVKAQNRAFCNAYFALEDECAKVGLTIKDLDNGS